MNLAETHDLLTLIASADNRRPDDATVLVWHPILSDLDASDCKAAAIEHFRTSDEYLMPVHIRRLVAKAVRERRRIERERREQAERLALESRPTSDRSTEILAAVRGMLPAGDPDKLRWGHRTWRQLQRQAGEQRTPDDGAA